MLAKYNWKKNFKEDTPKDIIEASYNLHFVEYQGKKLDKILNIRYLNTEPEILIKKRRMFGRDFVNRIYFEK